MQPQQPSVLIEHLGSLSALRADQCAHSLLGGTVDLTWNKHSAVMTLRKASSNQFSYTEQDGIQYFQSVPFRHGEKCPLMDENVVKKKQSPVKPCACVLIIDAHSQQVLVTRRTRNISFGGAWVLPGGHLEPQEGLLEGGLRQCKQEVNLPTHRANIQINRPVMIWESVSVRNQAVSSCAIILFFTAEAQPFQVTVQPKQVECFIWKNILDEADESKYSAEKGVGYAEGHLNYLRMYRKYSRNDNYYE